MSRAAFILVGIELDMLKIVPVDVISGCHRRLVKMNGRGNAHQPFELMEVPYIAGTLLRSREIWNTGMAPKRAASVAPLLTHALSKLSTNSTRLYCQRGAAIM